MEFVPSEICTTLFRFVTALATGAAGAGVAAAAVVILAGAAAKLFTAKVNGPPKPPVVIFCTATVAGFAALVKVQVILAAGKILAAGIVRTLPLNVPKLAGFAVIAELASVQVADEIVKLAFAASVKVTAVPDVETAIAVGVTGAAVPATVVVTLAGAAERLVAVNVNGPPKEPVVNF